ncbi:MAG: acylphosphatase [Myxococcaceae bacterium]
MSRRRIHVILSGRVQGVFFRRATVEVAERLGLAGWVQNLGDGRLELEAEGSEEALDAFLAFCRRGPEAARVDQLLVVHKPARDEVGFRLKEGE